MYSKGIRCLRFVGSDELWMCIWNNGTVLQRFVEGAACIVEGYLKPSLVLRGDSLASKLLDSLLSPVVKQNH